MIIIKLFVGPGARTFNLEITTPAGPKRFFDLPADQIYLRVGEHTNNAIQTVCNDFEQRLKTIRSSNGGVDQPNQTTKETNENG